MTKQLKVKTKKNLKPRTIKLLREVQKFLIAEPRRFDMTEGVRPSQDISSILEQPPCGTACCIAGAAYVIHSGFRIDKRNPPNLTWDIVKDYINDHFLDITPAMEGRLFYVLGPHYGIIPGQNGWPQIYTDAYKAAKTPLERACIGVARIEHFIQTDGAE